MFTEMMMSSGSGGGGTANSTYTGVPSSQSFSKDIQKSDHVVAIMFLTSGSTVELSTPCVLKPGQSGTLNISSTTTQITFSSDGQNISYSKNSPYYYVMIMAFSTT